MSDRLPLYPVGADASAVVVRFMSMSRRLDERMVVESTPAPGETDCDMETVAFFLFHLLRVEGIMFSLADGSVGFARHKVLSSSAARRLRELVCAMDAFEARAAVKAPAPLREDESRKKFTALATVPALFRDLSARLANVLLLMP